MLKDLEISDDDYKLIIFGGVTIVLYLSMFVRTISMIFILNFGTGQLNPTILLFFATLSGFLYLFVAHNYFPHSNQFFLVSFSLGFVTILLTVISNPIFSLIFSVAFQVLSTPTLISLLVILRKKFALSGAMGIGINYFVISILNYATFYATFFGILILLLLAMIWLAYGFYVYQNNFLIDFDMTELSSTSSLVGFIAIESVMLGFPNVLSTWNNTSLIVSLFLLTIGLLIAVLIIVYYAEIFTNQEFLPLILYLISLVMVIWVRIPWMYFIAILLLQISCLLLFAIGIRDKANDSVRIMGTKMGILQAIALLLIFLQISTPFWLGLPTLFHSLLRDNAELFTLLVGLILPTSASLAFYWRD